MLAWWRAGSVLHRDSQPPLPGSVMWLLKIVVGGLTFILGGCCLYVGIQQDPLVLLLVTHREALWRFNFLVLRLCMVAVTPLYMCILNSPQNHNHDQESGLNSQFCSVFIFLFGCSLWWPIRPLILRMTLKYVSFKLKVSLVKVVKHVICYERTVALEVEGSASERSWVLGKVS